MRKSHELLLRYFHDPAFSFSEVDVCYIDRGAPGDTTCVKGERIPHLDAYYMEIASPFGTTAIPYHRILRILYRGVVVWERGRKEKRDIPSS